MKNDLIYLLKCCALSFLFLIFGYLINYVVHSPYNSSTFTVLVSGFRILFLIVIPFLLPVLIAGLVISFKITEVKRFKTIYSIVSFTLFFLAIFITFCLISIFNETILALQLSQLTGLLLGIWYFKLQPPLNQEEFNDVLDQEI